MSGRLRIAMAAASRVQIGLKNPMIHATRRKCEIALQTRAMKGRARLLLVAWVLAGAYVSAQGQPGVTAPGSSRPFEIMDNSFLVEEAFNQESGIVQNILVFTHTRASGWGLGFTQEWPAPGQTHQLSYTVPYVGANGESGAGDVLINYRWQALVESAGRPAFAPRASVVLPTGSTRKGFGNGAVGLQVNLPFSKQAGDLYLHWGGGFTYLPGVETPIEFTQGPERLSREIGLFSPLFAASAIWRVRPMLNLMFETSAAFDQFVDGPGSAARERTITISPGLRGGWNIDDTQIVLGLAMPVSFAGGSRDPAVLTYFSYELPFRK
jgi:hypothetical protein